MAPEGVSVAQLFSNRQAADRGDRSAIRRLRRRKMSKFNSYECRKQPGFKIDAFEGANHTIPKKTLVIC